MSWEPFQEPTGSYTGPYIEYSAHTSASGPQMPPPFAETAGHWHAAGPQGPVAPLSLWDAIKQLPRQYWRIITKPSAATFAEEMGRARWDVIWAQVLGISAFSALMATALWLVMLGFISASLASMNTNAGSFDYHASLGWLLIPAPLFGLATFINGVGSFFVGEGIKYLLAKAFGGQGSFKEQAYTSLLYYVPIDVGTLLLSCIPFVGLFASVAAIYAYVLEVFQQMAVHRLSVGRALAVVLIPIGVGLLLGLALVTLYLYFVFSFINTWSVPS